MFEGCTIKYNKSPLTGQNCSVQVTYPAASDGSVKSLSVPMKTDNTDYQEILEWVDAGNTIQEAD